MEVLKYFFTQTLLMPPSGGGRSIKYKGYILKLLVFTNFQSSGEKQLPIIDRKMLSTIIADRG